MLDFRTGRILKQTSYQSKGRFRLGFSLGFQEQANPEETRFGVSIPLDGGLKGFEQIWRPGTATHEKPCSVFSTSVGEIKRLRCMFFVSSGPSPDFMGKCAKAAGGAQFFFNGFRVGQMPFVSQFPVGIRIHGKKSDSSFCIDTITAWRRDALEKKKDQPVLTGKTTVKVAPLPFSLPTNMSPPWFLMMP